MVRREEEVASALRARCGDEPLLAGAIRFLFLLGSTPVTPAVYILFIGIKFAPAVEYTRATDTGYCFYCGRALYRQVPSNGNGPRDPLSGTSAVPILAASGGGGGGRLYLLSKAHETMEIMFLSVKWQSRLGSQLTGADNSLLSN